jgi:alcohol dehydrogenase YqhD (iron-dependent ADH family)
MNKGAVISNDDAKVKSFVTADCLFPQVALVDPELTLTVPKDQTAYGVCDIITHVTEGYFTGVDGTPIQDRFAEGVIINTIEWGQKAVADGSDLEERTQVQWASIVALNGWVQVGTNYTPPVHMIEHALSAHHNITHGAGLAVLNPAWMRFVAKARPERLTRFAQRIFGLSATAKDDLSLAMAGIDKFQDFLRSIGCSTRLSELGIGDGLISRYAEDAVLVVHDENGNLPGRPPMSKEDIVEVLRTAL